VIDCAPRHSRIEDAKDISAAGLYRKGINVKQTVSFAVAGLAFTQMMGATVRFGFAV